jgi:hypothetical protein
MLWELTDAGTLMTNALFSAPAGTDYEVMPVGGLTNL